MTQAAVQDMVKDLQTALGLSHLSIQVRFLPDDDDTLCSVDQFNGGMSRQRWILRVYDAALKEEPDAFYFLLLHEFSHILTCTEIEDATHAIKSIVQEDQRVAVAAILTRSGEMIAESVASALVRLRPLTTPRGTRHGAGTAH